jgi:hypothetical protein
MKRSLLAVRPLLPRHGRTVVLGLCASLLLIGCSERRDWKPVYPVRGQVFYQGQPAVGARVVLHPAAGEPEPRYIPPQAVVGADGSFVLTTYQAQDGAPAGAYVAVVFKLSGKGPPNLLPERYESPETSPLRVTVVEGENDLEAFHLAD